MVCSPAYCGPVPSPNELGGLQQEEHRHKVLGGTLCSIAVISVAAASQLVVIQ